MLRRIRARRAERKNAKNKETVFRNRNATTELATDLVINHALTLTISEDESDYASITSPTPGSTVANGDQLHFSTKVQKLEESIRKKDATMVELKELHRAAMAEKEEVIGKLQQELETTNIRLSNAQEEIIVLKMKHGQEIDSLETELENQKEKFNETKNTLHIVSAELMNIQHKYYEQQEESHLNSLAEFGKGAAKGFLNLISF